MNNMGRPCCVWVVEFTKGVIKGCRKKLYITSTDMTVIDVIRMVRVAHPSTEFVVYNVDAGILIIPEKMTSGDILYQLNNVRINQDGDMVVEELDDEPGFDDTDSQIITVKPPNVAGELG